MLEVKEELDLQVELNAEVDLEVHRGGEGTGRGGLGVEPGVGLGGR